MRYLVETTFKGIPTPEALALIPAEMARGRELDALGVREWLLVAADQSKAWQLFHVDSVDVAHALAASFPLHPFVNVVITPIAEQAA